MPQSRIAQLLLSAILLGGVPAAASAAPEVAPPRPIIAPSPEQPIVVPPRCWTAAPQPGDVKFAASPTKVRQGTSPRLKFSITNVGKTCLGHSAAPYKLQQSGFAGWSDVKWDVGPITKELRTLRPGQSFTGITAPLPNWLGAGGFYRLVPTFLPDAPEPVAAAPIDVIDRPGIL